MTNRFGVLLHPDDVRWAAAEGVPEDVIAAVLLLHERRVDEIVPSLSAAEIEQVIKLVGRSPSVYPPGTLEALKSKRNASPTPMAESRAKKQTPSTAGADHPLRDHTRAYRGFGTAAQQSTIEHVGGAAASQNTAAVTDQPPARIKPDAEQMRMAHERRLAMLRAHTPQSDTEPERANPSAPAVKREAEEDWGGKRWGRALNMPGSRRFPAPWIAEDNGVSS